MIHCCFSNQTSPPALLAAALVTSSASARFSKYLENRTTSQLTRLARKTLSIIVGLVMTVAAGPHAAANPTPPAEQLIEEATELRLQRCFEEISQANQSFAEGRADIANERLLQLTYSCTGVAHLYHNLGAIAALRRDWDQAITYLQQSLAIDRRAAQTQAGLSGIYQYKAALAYREALDLSGPLPKPPAIALQNGKIGNGPVARPVAVRPATADHSTQAPGSGAAPFDVAGWWIARRVHSPELPPWSAVNYSIDELEKDLTLVLLEFAKNRHLLVIRKTDNRWQIIGEKQL